MYTHYRYAAERIEKLESANQLTRKSRYANWKPVTPMEMEGFLAIIVNMGLIQLPDIESYWNTSWVGHIPFFGRMFSRNRFEQIFWMLHVSRDDPNNPNRRLNKVKDIMERLVPNPAMLSTRTQHLCR